MTYRIRNWDKFQHYKDRNPPWIKLHFSVLSSQDWVMLDDRSRVLAIACMLVASRSGGEFPDDPAYIRRVAYLNSPPNFKPLLDCGFLELDSGCKQMIAEDTQETEERRDREETETEGEKRQKRPSVDEVDSYIKKMGYRGFTGQQFIDHYTANGWKVGRNPMKDWQAATRTWASRSRTTPTREKFGGEHSVKREDRPCQYCGGAYPCKCYEEAKDG